jgi:hypothetical protein
MILPPSAVLLDIDHSPEHFLAEKNRAFYGAEGLESLRKQLKTEGVFALWSNDPADEKFTKHLESVFGAAAHNIEFTNPYTNFISINSACVASDNATKI